MSRSAYADELMTHVRAKNPGEMEFHQAVREVVESLAPVLERHPEYVEDRILERLVEPERVIVFRVPWVDDAGEIQVNRGYRVEMSSAIGPFKGGLRFHPTVYVGLLKFLAFEQVFKNALTTLPDGRRQGRRGLRPEGQERRRGDALLPVVHDRAAAPHRAVHRRPGRRHRRRRAGDRLPLRAVQADPQRVHRRAHRQGARVGRLADPPRGDRLRLGLLRRRRCSHPRRRAGGQGVPRLRQRQRRPVHGREAHRPRRPAASRCRTRAASSTTPTGSTPRSSPA